MLQKSGLYLGFSLVMCSQYAMAAETAVASPTASLIKTIFGLMVVLAVMAAIAWAVKRVTPGKGSMQSVARIVGGVSVGSRERVVVIEVAGRWLVVGVAPGQVNAIANLDIVEGGLAISEPTNLIPGSQALAAKGQAFAGWLKKSLEKSQDKGTGGK